jgi:hypothetical protein
MSEHELGSRKMHHFADPDIPILKQAKAEYAKLQ